uniref:HDC17258 n=1 Tax=Drosophila melanogaster TaxID=7227 RepID=Q6IIS2_DROME|nr:TPA_inf: HDC17258 [Drosophila melanogaster]
MSGPTKRNDEQQVNQHFAIPIAAGELKIPNRPECPADEPSLPIVEVDVRIERRPPCAECDPHGGHVVERIALRCRRGDVLAAQAPCPSEEECHPHSSDKWYDNCYKLWWHLATAWQNLNLLRPQRPNGVTGGSARWAPVVKNSRLRQVPGIQHFTKNSSRVKASQIRWGRDHIFGHDVTGPKVRAVKAITKWLNYPIDARF